MASSNLKPSAPKFNTKRVSKPAAPALVSSTPASAPAPVPVPAPTPAPAPVVATPAPPPPAPAKQIPSSLLSPLASIATASRVHIPVPVRPPDVSGLEALAALESSEEEAPPPQQQQVTAPPPEPKKLKAKAKAKGKAKVTSPLASLVEPPVPAPLPPPLQAPTPTPPPPAVSKKPSGSLKKPAAPKKPRKASVPRKRKVEKKEEEEEDDNETSGGTSEIESIAAESEDDDNSDDISTSAPPRKKKTPLTKEEEGLLRIQLQHCSRLPLTRVDKDGTGDMICSMIAKAWGELDPEYKAEILKAKEDPEAKMPKPRWNKEAVNLLVSVANSFVQERLANMVHHGADNGLARIPTKDSEFYITGKVESGVNLNMLSPIEQQYLFSLQVLEKARNIAKSYLASPEMAAQVKRLDKGGENMHDLVVQVRARLYDRLREKMEEYHAQGDRESIGTPEQVERCFVDFEATTNADPAFRREAQSVFIFNAKCLAMYTANEKVKQQRAEKDESEKRMKNSLAKVKRMEEGKKRKAQERVDSEAMEQATNIAKKMKPLRGDE